MSRAYQLASLLVIFGTLIWWVYALTQRHQVQWQYLTAGGIHFLMAIIINRQLTEKNYNYLGIIHVSLMILLFGYGYLFL
ncbi:hypothetical protein [Nonlabens xiamenensis]|uniref:hypothetical protein n=1 Tax=Nonlabens xiamenensis TaxID=2341043 RepID=UPI000F60D4EC|nr:hypothetical protein [Nonlabens xiamenensis]